MNESQLDRIENKVDIVTRETIENTTHLKDHMRRTRNIEERMVPVEAHIARWAGIGKGLTIVGSLLLMAAAVIKILEYF